MATFTALDDADVAAIAAGFALGAPASWRPIAAGTINSNFEVRTDLGGWFVRVNEGKSLADVRWEAEVVAALAARAVPTPPPLPAADGARWLAHRGLLVSAFSWSPGRHLAAGEVTPAAAAAVGGALARLHHAGLELGAAARRPSIYDHAHLQRRFATFADHPDVALAPAIAMLADELAWLDAQAPARAAATVGLIHGDLFRDNVLFDGDRLAALLDFEQASGGSLAYDLAVCLADWAWADGPRPELAAALVAGYDRVRPRPDDERRALPIELRAAAARFTITRITDVYLPGHHQPDKDFRAFLARVRRFRDPAAPPLVDVG